MAVHNVVYDYINNEEYLIYVRVSTDKDEQISSVPNQIDVCRYWLETNGFEWNENAVFKDEGISGTVLLARPAMQMILEKAKRREIKMVVFKSLNRLARDTKDALEIREVLSAHNVRIISVEEGYDSFKVSRNDMSYEMSSLFAEQYSRMLSVNISGVLAAKVRRGEHIGKIPYGYDRIEGRLVPKEEEAKHIRQIFEWYNTGWGFKRIAIKLNEMGVPSKQGGKWQLTSIQRIVRNPVYCGDFILNQYRKEKVAGRKKQIRNPEEKWLIFKDHHQGIIPRDMWEKANEKTYTKNKRKVTPWNELRGIVKCSECDSSMVIVQSWNKKKDGSKTRWDYLKCSQYRRGGKDVCVNHKPILYKDFRLFVINLLLEKGKEIALNLSNEFESSKKTKINILKRNIEQLEGKKKDLLDLYLDKHINKEEFEEKRHEIDIELNKKRDDLLQLQNKEHSQIQIKSVQEAFKAIENQDEDHYEAFKTLLKKITMHPDGTIDAEYTFENEED